MTVRMLADMCDVHYNTMRNWLATNNIQKEGNSRNSKFMITDEVIKMARDHFNKEEDIDTDKSGDFLKDQLRQKDIQIDKLQNQIEHLHKLLENQQVLTLKAQEKIQLLEYEEELQMENVEDSIPREKTEEDSKTKTLEESISKKTKGENKNIWWKFWKK